MSYLRNCWYMIAWSHEVGETLLVRTVLDMPIVLYRKSEGGLPVALFDRCPHRFAPMSRGTKVGDNVRCGYHGLVFDGGGNCVHNPWSNAIPAAAKIRSFPIVERDNVVWIWSGDPALATPASVPTLMHSDTRFRWEYGLTEAKSDYRLLIDNLMDLTHTAFIHPGFGGEAYKPKYKSWEEGESVVSDYVVDELPDFLGGGTDKLRGEDRIWWSAPALLHLINKTINLGPSKEELVLHGYHILTPETANTTHYFWSGGVSHDFPHSGAQLKEMLSFAFDKEDKPMIEAVQCRMNGEELFELNPVLLPTDTGSVRVRRKLQKQIDDERQKSAAST